MTRIDSLMAGLGAIALSLGVAGQGNLPKEIQVPWSNHDIVIVKNDAARPIGQTDNGNQQSAEMDKAPGVHDGQNQGETPKTRSAKMTGAQPAETSSAKD
jgi:hypothetical protein